MGGTYDCPLYKVLTRKGVLLTTGHSTNFVMMPELPTDQDPDMWTRAGVASVLALKTCLSYVFFVLRALLAEASIFQDLVWTRAPSSRTTGMPLRTALCERGCLRSGTGWFPPFFFGGGASYRCSVRRPADFFS